MRNLGLKLFKAPKKIQDYLRASRPYLECYRVLSLICKEDINTLKAYQDSHKERNLENSKKLYVPFLSNAGGIQKNLEGIVFKG